jgi:hypothetical protein
MRPRAYWISENPNSPKQHRTPHFVDTNSSAGLPAIPVYLSPPEETNLPALYAGAATNGQSFGLYSGATKTASQKLPSYNDGTAQVEKVLLTPAMIAGDLTIIGGIIGYIYIGGLGGG